MLRDSPFCIRCSSLHSSYLYLHLRQAPTNQNACSTVQQRTLGCSLCSLGAALRAPQHAHSLEEVRAVCCLCGFSNLICAWTWMCRSFLQTLQLGFLSLYSDTPLASQGIATMREQDWGTQVRRKLCFGGTPGGIMVEFMFRGILTVSTLPAMSSRELARMASIGRTSSATSSDMTLQDCGRPFADSRYTFLTHFMTE